MLGQMIHITMFFKTLICSHANASLSRMQQYLLVHVHCKPTQDTCVQTLGKEPWTAHTEIKYKLLLVCKCSQNYALYMF